MRFFRGFALAFSMLSIIPFFKVHHFFKGINGYGAMFYPLVGFILGAILFALYTLLDPYMPKIHLSVVIFTLWVVLSGALHLDGFSDTVDGLFVSKERALEVMKDSHIGGMGMIFTLVFLLLKLSSIIYFQAYYLLPVLLMISRFNATLAIYFFPYIGGGMGSFAKEELKLWQLLISIVYVVVITLLFHQAWILLISSLTLLSLALFFTHRLGGLSGDIYGFIIEMSELILLNAILLVNYNT